MTMTMTKMEFSIFYEMCKLIFLFVEKLKRNQQRKLEHVAEDNVN